MGAGRNLPVHWLWWLAAVLLTGCQTPAPPQLRFHASVGPALQALSEDTWRQFRHSFAGRLDCIGDVTLAAEQGLPHRAHYAPETATVTVRVPATAALLREALVHEWAHHVEYQCAEQTAFRPAFLVALGRPSGTSWRSAAVGNMAWVETPAELYAEAAVIVVLGRRQVPTGAVVTAEAVTSLQAWASGDVLLRMEAR